VNVSVCSLSDECLSVCLCVCVCIHVLDENYANYRAALATSTPPVIPYLGLWLRDLTHIEDGMVGEDGMLFRAFLFV
jgi:RasGEF domain